jgi:hypothetical protein
MHWAKRKRPVHGVAIGIMVLDTSFERLPGDIANALTWRFPVQFEVVRGVTPQHVIGGDPADYLPPFFAAIDKLVGLGVDGITTSCGFLAASQARLAAYSPVPVAATSLLQIPLVLATLPAGKTVGILASDRANLTAEHFLGVGAPPSLPVAELPANGVIRSNMREGAITTSYADQEREAVAVTEAFLSKHPDIGAIVQECANLAPYSARLQAIFGLPIYDIVSLVDWFHAGLRPRRWQSNFNKD